MDLDPGHGARHRRGLDVVEADRRGADQHQLAGDHVGRDVFLQHIDRGDIDRGIVAGIVNPELAVMVGRNLKPLDADALDAGLFGLDQDGAGSGGDAQNLECQRGHGLALRLHDHRHPPDDAVALGPDREQATPRGGMLQHRHVAQQAREIEHEALRLLAQHREPGDRQRLVERRDFLRQAGFAEHDAGRLDGVGEDLVVARQRAQLGAGLLIEVAEGIGRKGGLSRSGSENTASKAITTAPSRVSSVTRSAIRVRGHGHCPSFSRLLSSISTMVTGLMVFLRGSMRWKASKVLTRISSTGAGSATRSAANPISSARHSSRA